MRIAPLRPLHSPSSRSSWLALPLLLPLGCFADPPTIGPTTDAEPTDDGTSSSDGPDDATSTSGPADGSGSTRADESGSSDDGPASTDDTADDTTGPAASTGDPLAPRVAFVTEGAHFADLGGIAGADARCAAEAEAADLPGEFLAWISDAEASPADRFARDGGPWVRTDGTTLADDWDDLTDGTLDHPIELDATGQPLDDQLAVWTNTAWDGTALGSDCQGWTSAAFEHGGIFGDFAQSSEFGQWTAWGNPTPFPCENTFHLYCFEQ